MSVLIVDDTPANVAFLRQLLVRQGLSRVYSETDSREVSRRLAEHQPDLVLLDLRMPHVDGFEVLAQVHEFAAGSYLPVMVFTADTTTDFRARAGRNPRRGRGSHPGGPCGQVDRPGVPTDPGPGHR